MEKREDGDVTIRRLFEEFWIVKRDQPELFHDLSKLVSSRMKATKDARQFIQEELGYSLKIREGAMRVVKRPNKGSAKPWMGISDFQNKEEYMMMTVLLDYLSDDNNSQFLFGDYKTYLDEFPAPNCRFDWEKKNTRYQIRRVLEVAEKFGLITCVEGNVQNRFVEEFDGGDFSRIALYDNNRLVRDFLPEASSRIFDIQGYEDFSEMELGDPAPENDMGAAAKRFALRELLLTPSYHESDWKEGYDYLKQKPMAAERVAEQLEKYLGIHVAYTSHTAFSTVDAEASRIKQTFLFSHSNQLYKMILSFNTLLREYMEPMEREPDDSLVIPEEQLELLFAALYEREARDWTVEYREKPRNYCYEEVKRKMEELKFIKISGGTVRLLPQIVKIIGTFNLADPEAEKPEKSEKPENPVLPEPGQISFI